MVDFHDLLMGTINEVAGKCLIVFKYIKRDKLHNKRLQQESVVENILV